MTTTEKIAALLRRLRVEMNGAVTDAMRAYGGQRREYGLNYGVSLPTIRDVAREYAPDQELSRALWRQDVRELKLAALFVADPASVTAAQMEEWGAGWSGTEMAEQCAMQLFWQSPEALEIARRWVERGEKQPYTFRAGLFMLGKMAGDPRVGDEPLRQIINGCSAAAAEGGGGTALEYALRELYRWRSELREDLGRLLERLPEPIAAAVRWQIEYLG